MKKICTLLLLGLATAGAAQAQYLTNGGFEGDWEKCTPFVSGNNKAPTVGTQPTGWHAANVAGYYMSVLGWMGQTTVVSKDDSGHNGVAAKMKNTNTLGNIIPGYMALGTPWNTANTSGQNADGGTFGGVTFTSQPDAFEFYYKYTKGKAENTQPASVVAYMWKGSTSQADVPANVAKSAATTVTMVNRDYNILGRQHALGGNVTKSDDFELIATIGAENEKEDEQGYRSEVLMTEEKVEWTHMVCPFTYYSANKPEMINIIFASMENWAGKASNEDGNSLTVDDVNLLYWNTLSSLTYDGVELLEDNKTTYDNSSVSYDADKLSATAKSQFATTDISYDETSAVATITVTREYAETKVYTIQFKKAGGEVPSKEIVDTKTYPKTIVVIVDGISASPQDANIDVTYYDNSTIDFTLKNFILGEGEEAMPIGNIAIENLKIENGQFTFNDNLLIQNGDDENITWWGPWLKEIPLDLKGEINDAQNYFFVNIDIDLGEQVVNVQAGDPIPAKLTLTDAGAGTFVAPFPVTIPVDEETEEPLFTASTVTDIQNGYLVLSPCDGAIPAKTPVVIQGEANEFNFAIIKNREYVEPTPSTSGLLTGIYAPTTVPLGSYVLQKQDKVAFFKVTGDFTLGANRCYLTIPQGNSARAIYFGEDILTALNAAVTTNVSNAIYDLQGRRVNNADQKGVFIVNGKKVVK